MDVFIGNLADNVTLNDLTSLFKSYASKARISLSAKRCEDGSKIHFAVAEFETEKLAKKAIKKFNGAALRGQRLLLREFFHRSYNNERRALNWRDKPWDGPERRKSERRRKLQPTPSDSFKEPVANMKSETEASETEIRISGYTNMARKF